MIAKIHLVIFICMLLAVCVRSNESIRTIEELGKLSIKELRKEILSRGLKCSGCLEKGEFVSYLHSNQHVSKKSVDEDKKRDEATGGQRSKDDPELEKLMEQLKKSGFGGKMYTKDDIEKEFGSASSRKKTSNNKRKAQEEVSEHIEL